MIIEKSGFGVVITFRSLDVGLFFDYHSTGEGLIHSVSNGIFDEFEWR